MKKILMIMPFLSGGGAEKVFMEVATELSKNGYIVEIMIVSSAINNVDVSKLPPNIKFCFLDTSVKKAFITLIKEIRSRDVDVIFSNFLKINLQIGLAIKLRLLQKNIKFVARENNIPSIEMREFGYPKIIWSLYPIAYNMFDSIISQSNDMRDDMIALGVEAKRVTKINNPPPGVTELNELNDNFKVISIGRLSNQKGYDYLLKVMSLLPKNISLDIYGTGELHQKLLNDINKLNLCDRVELKGHVDSDTLKYAMRNASCLALPSRYEGYPNVLLEALSKSLPVVVFDIKGGINEIVINGVNGYITPCFDVRTYANNIKESFNLDRSEINRDYINRFSRNEVFEKYISLVENG